MSRFKRALSELIVKWAHQMRKSSKGNGVQGLSQPQLSNTGGRLVTRTLIVLVVGVGAVRFLPSLAENLSTIPVNNQPIGQESSSVVPLPIADTYVVASTSTVTSPGFGMSVTVPTPSILSPSAAVTYLDSGTVAYSKPVIRPEDSVVHIPSTVKVDPRARTIFLPKFVGSGNENLEMCLSAPNSRIKIIATGPVTPVYREATTVYKTETGTISTPTSLVPVDAIVGNGGNKLILTGTLSNIVNTINGDRGLIVESTSGELSGSDVLVKLVSLSEPSTDSHYCEESTTMSNSYEIHLQPLNVELNQAIGVVKLHNK